MAEAVIVGIAGKIVAYLVPQALDNVGMLRGVNRELEALGDTVSTLQSVLAHAEEQYHQSLQIKDWVDKLKEAFYDAQDVLEEFNIEAMRRELRGHNEMKKEVRTFFSSSNQLAFKMKMSYKLRAVREKMEAIKADKEFHLDERPERESRKGKDVRPIIHEGPIIGREDDKKKIMKFLLDSDVQENVSILPIVGIGGLGKTALALSVYNDEKVSKQFDLKMWVCVSNDFDMTKIVKTMIACAKKGEPTKVKKLLPNELLPNELWEEINGKRYLLVLDDLWDENRETWSSLRTLLSGGARGSKILITTRLSLVAKITGTTQVYSLRGLSDGMSFALLMQIACCKEEELQDPNMRVIGEDIVRKCSGVPLVIRTVGNLLFPKQTKSEWSHFKDYELPEVRQTEDIISVLKLSYDNLPSHLKQCFAFCSLFPKDYELKKQTLVDLWMAEGFIQPPNRGQHLEDIAHKYFMHLLQHNFFQEFQEDVGTCKMHDLMHDLACSVAGTECWGAWDDTKSIHERTRHISHNLTSNLMGKLPIRCLKVSALRTYLYTSEDVRKEPTSEADLHQLIQSLKRLRILDLHATGIKKVPRSIYKFKHLTYLDLSYNDALKRLPNSITGLQNLQNLNLSHCGSLEELPRDIRKLVSLQILNIDDCDKLSYMPCGLGQLSSLHRLNRFILPEDKALAKKYCGLGELNRLNNIRGTLSIQNLGSEIDAVEESQAANLREKRSLEFLSLSWGNFDITDEAIIKKRDEALLDGLRPPDNLQKLIIMGYEGESFPRWMTELSNLVELTLNYCNRCKHFPQSGLSESKHHDTVGMNSLEYLPGECLGSFASLESLHIEGLSRLNSLALGSLPKLVKLTIRYCDELDLSKDESGNIILDFHGLQSLRFLEVNYLPKLKSLPQWIQQLRSLERLDIYNCSNFKALSEESEESEESEQLEASSKEIEESEEQELEASSEKNEKCEEVDISKDESGNNLDFHGGFQRLRFVTIYGLSELTSLPQWLLQARNLESLQICQCRNLKDIPEQIEALQSLQYLLIRECPSLTSFPEAMRRLTSLIDLQISDCGELGKSCKRQVGEDWDKIAHIPCIQIGWENVR